MDTAIFFYGIVPLIVFVLIDSIAGMRAALVLAFLVALAEIGVIYSKTGEWDRLSIIAAALIAILGGVSVATNNRRYFKFQPVVLSLLMAVFLAYLQLSPEPLVYRYRELIVETAPPMLGEVIHNEGFFQTLNFFVNWLVGLFILNAALIAYTAVYCRTVVWLIARGVGFWVLVGLMLLLMFAYMYFWLAPQAGVGPGVLSI